MNITVIGCGRWGSLIAWYLDRIGHRVTLYGRAGSSHMERFLESRSNDLLTLPPSVALSTDLEEAIGSDVILIAVGAQSLRTLARQLAGQGIHNKKIVLCMKGLEKETGLRLTQIVESFLPDDNQTAVWLGPGHVQEFYAGIPNCMVIDSRNRDVKKELVEAFSSDLIRFYYGQDLIGNEIGAASKNVIGIAAGMLDGMGYVTLKGPLISRGTREISRLIAAAGGSELSAYGLCHLGDYEATVFSPYSHNRQYGEAFVRGVPYDSLAEGRDTSAALMILSSRLGVELPICRTVYSVLFEGLDPRLGMETLLRRPLKNEF